MNITSLTVAKLKDIGTRAALTFVQAFAAAFVLPPVAQMGQVGVWEAAALAGVAAGISAVMNLLRNVGPTPAVKMAAQQAEAKAGK